MVIGGIWLNMEIIQQCTKTQNHDDVSLKLIGYRMSTLLRWKKKKKEENLRPAWQLWIRRKTTRSNYQWACQQTKEPFLNWRTCGYSWISLTPLLYLYKYGENFFKSCCWDCMAAPLTVLLFAILWNSGVTGLTDKWKCLWTTISHCWWKNFRIYWPADC